MKKTMTLNLTKEEIAVLEKLLRNHTSSNIQSVLSEVANGFLDNKTLYRCKDFADGWIPYLDKDDAIDYQEQTGCLTQVLSIHWTEVDLRSEEGQLKSY